MPLVKVNDLAQIKLEESAEELNAQVNFVQPFYKEGENFTKVRVYLPTQWEISCWPIGFSFIH